MQRIEQSFEEIKQKQTLSFLRQLLAELPLLPSLQMLNELQHLIQTVDFPQLGELLPPP